MVLAYHVIFTAHGFWLPNDPRGSWSDFVREWELAEFGKATKIKITGRRSVARKPHDRELRKAAKRAMKYAPVTFTGNQALSIANGFNKGIRESGYIIVACSVLPDHVHLVVLRHERLAERIIGHLKSRATQELLAQDLHPFGQVRDGKGRVPPAWTHHGWKVFLNSVDDILRAIRYVEGNPVKEGKRKQIWSFVTPFSVAILENALRKRRR